MNPDPIFEWLEAHEGPLAYLVLALAALLEYVFPPLPGDVIALFGTFLAATAGYSGLLVYLALTLGALGGGMLAWAFGRWLGPEPERWPRLLRGPRTRRAIGNVLDRFERHGAAYLALNRFVPALRGFFFVAAGMRQMPAPTVAFWGGLSAAAWNGLILAVGYAAGTQWETLQLLLERYTWGAVMVVTLVVVVAGVRARRG